MLFLHLHSRRRDAPFRGVEIEFRPFSRAQLARTNEHQRCEAQRCLCRWLSVVGVNRAQKLADDYAVGFLFELAKVGVENAKLKGMWENAPTQATDLTGVSWEE